MIFFIRLPTSQEVCFKALKNVDKNENEVPGDFCKKRFGGKMGREASLQRLKMSGHQDAENRDSGNPLGT